MNVITAVEPIDCFDTKPTIFLAGGITNCPGWHDEIIKMLEPYNDGVLLNPRRKNFPIHDPNASKEQITWEFNALNRCSIFSMWFSAGESVQPICMYELGRHLAWAEHSHRPFTCTLIGVEPGYKREQDVRIQSQLVAQPSQYQFDIASTLEQHANNILEAAKSWNFQHQLA